MTAPDQPTVSRVGNSQVLTAEGRELARDTLFLPLGRDIRWPESRVSVSCANNKAVFTSDTFAWRVCLDLDGEQGLPDNFFDVYPGIPTILDWPDTLGEPRILRVGNDAAANPSGKRAASRRTKS